ncbi:IPT/TIG domain-containing protein [Streptomyces hygroscopicus]|uniref:IPT/TIG domain-containing protein n=1 Tax=Streptomyces hygroscopicus TaxID=1912 RepID=UPI0004C9BB85|nr:IPT/TIG domain-containing protein [Streptomyces hygroscopicus]
MAPVVTSVSPAQGPPAGGTSVTLTGSGFTGATAVRFGPSLATDVVVLSNTQITARTPPGSGTEKVTVTGPSGTSTILTNSATQITVSAPAGPPSSVSVTVTTAGGTRILTNSATQITVSAPAGPPSSVSVTVTTAGGTSNPLPYFYIAAPTVSDLSPHFGPATGSNTVTVFGSNLSLTTAVHFGGNPATAVTVVSDSQLTVTAPAGSGTVAVTVTTPGGTSTAGTGNPYYTYLGAPVLTSLNPSHGASVGGDAIVLTGTNLTYTDAVTFGGAPASFSAISDTQVVATSPAGAPGTVNVVAHTPAGNSNALPYVYDPA